ncbi:hypothetical protein ACQKWADRAFT_283683 [Trichoderma austrokoningii]
MDEGEVVSFFFLVTVFFLFLFLFLVCNFGAPNFQRFAVGSLRVFFSFSYLWLFIRRLRFWHSSSLFLISGRRGGYGGS